MPRRPRLLLPGIPLHITQRGVNRGATFIDAEDYRLYLALLAEVGADHDIGVRAYALMGNHLHLLATRHVAATSPVRCGCSSNDTPERSTVATGGPEPCGKAASDPASCRPSAIC